MVAEVKQRWTQAFTSKLTSYMALDGVNSVERRPVRSQTQCKRENMAALLWSLSHNWKDGRCKGAFHVGDCSHRALESWETWRCRRGPRDGQWQQLPLHLLSPEDSTPGPRSGAVCGSWSHRGQLMGAQRSPRAHADNVAMPEGGGGRATGAPPSPLSSHLSSTPHEAAICGNDLMLPSSEIMASEDARKS